jgi:hypothetical protein
MCNNKNSIYMKTSTLPFRTPTIYCIVGFLSIFFTSCGSYQNSSYYDSDGIYGNTPRTAVDVETQNASNNQYKNYFGSLQNNNQTVEIFTDVDNYNDFGVENDSMEDNGSYPGWGSNPQTVSINVYDNNWGMNNWGMNNWGMNGGFGWGINNWGMNNWGMNGLGWGMNNWGWNGGFGWGMNNWGMNNWGWNGGFGWGMNNWGMNGGFGWNNWGYSNDYNNRPYSYNPGRRGSAYANAANGDRNATNYTRSQNTSINRRAINSDYRGNNSADFGRGSNNRMNRTSPVFSRNQGQSRNNPNYNPSRRGNNNNARNENNRSERSYTPSSRNDNNSRSYSPSSNSSGNSGGSGRSSGGGGRSSGGGGRGGITDTSYENVRSEREYTPSSRNENNSETYTPSTNIPEDSGGGGRSGEGTGRGGRG